jgi:hypothetical protein
VGFAIRHVCQGIDGMRYRDFDLKLSGSDNNFYVEVIASPRSARTEPIPFHLENDEIDIWRKKAAAGLSIRQVTRTLGISLFNAVFPREVLSIWTQSCVDACSAHPLRLRLDIRSAELARVPWEIMHDGHGYLTLTNSMAMVRCSLNRRWFGADKSAGPLNILLVTAAPRDTISLPNIERETESIVDVLSSLRADAKIARVDIIRGAKRERLQATLARTDYHVLHYIGHGAFENDNGYLLFEDEQGRTEPLDAETLSAFFADAPLRLLFLNSCDTAIASATDPFMGVAPASLIAGVPAIVAMQGSVLDSVAAQFAHRFYENLASQRPLEFCMSEARKAINNTTGAEWSLPVLFSNSEDGLLWSRDLPHIGASISPQPAGSTGPKFVVNVQGKQNTIGETITQNIYYALNETDE